MYTLLGNKSVARLIELCIINEHRHVIIGLAQIYRKPNMYLIHVQTVEVGIHNTEYRCNDLSLRCHRLDSERRDVAYSENH